MENLKINGVNSPSRQGMPTDVRRQREENVSVQPVVRQDSAQFSPEWKREVDWKAAAQEVLFAMKGKYPGIDLNIISEAGKGNLAENAARLGKGRHLLLSESFVEKMGSSMENYYACKSILDNIMRQLAAGGGKELGRGAFVDAGEVTFWSVPPQNPLSTDWGKEQESGLQRMLEAMRQGTKSQGGDFRMKVSPASFGTAARYAKMAAASSKSQVQKVIGDVHRDLATLRLVASFGDDKEKEKAKAAINSLERLLLRGSKKLKRFSEEELLSARRKRAQKQMEQRKAERIRQEIRKKKSARHGADSAMAAEGTLDEMNQALRFNRHDRDEEWEALGTGTLLPDAAGMPAVGMGVGTDGFTAADVVISPAVSLEG